MTKQYVKPFCEMVILSLNDTLLDIGFTNASTFAEEPLCKQIDMAMWEYEEEEETPHIITDLWADDEGENGW